MIKIQVAAPEDIPQLYRLYDKIGQKDEGYFERCFEEGRTILMASLPSVIPLACPQGHLHERDPEKEEQQSCSHCGSPLLVPASQAAGMTEEREARVGFGMLNWSPKYALYKKLDIPEIQDLNVAAEARQKGIATALIQKFEELAREKSCEYIGVSVGLTKDRGPAQRLYAKRGYLPDGNGVTYDRQPVSHGQHLSIDDDLCLMLIKGL